MADYTVTIPEAIYHRAEKIAEQSSRPVETVLVDLLSRLTEATPLLSLDEEAELQAMHYLSNDALQTIAEEEFSDALKARQETLMDKNSLGTISDNEFYELEALVERGQRLMVRKAEARLILHNRKNATS